MLFIVLLMILSLIGIVIVASLASYSIFKFYITIERSNYKEIVRSSFGLQVVPFLIFYSDKLTGKEKLYANQLRSRISILILFIVLFLITKFYISTNWAI